MHHSSPSPACARPTLSLQRPHKGEEEKLSSAEPRSVSRGLGQAGGGEAVRMPRGGAGGHTGRPPPPPLPLPLLPLPLGLGLGLNVTKRKVVQLQPASPLSLSLSLFLSLFRHIAAAEADGLPCLPSVLGRLEIPPRRGRRGGGVGGCAVQEEGRLQGRGPPR